MESKAIADRRTRNPRKHSLEVRLLAFSFESVDALSSVHLW